MKKVIINSSLLFFLGLMLLTSCQKESIKELDVSLNDKTTYVQKKSNDIITSKASVKKINSCCEIDSYFVQRLHHDLYQVCANIIAPLGSQVIITVHGQQTLYTVNNDCIGISICHKFRDCVTTITIQIIGPKGICDTASFAVC